VTVIAPAAQDGEPARDGQLPIFRTEANLVRVDMYATRNGTFVTDLRADEVEIYEDGDRQRIESFEYVNIPAFGGSGVNRAPSDQAPISQDVRSRVFVVFVDTHTARLNSDPELRLAIVRFLDELLGPTDLVGLMTPDMQAEDLVLGRRSTVISDFANDDRWSAPREEARPDLREFAWENCYPTGGGRGGGSNRLSEMKARYNGVVTIESLNDLVNHLRTLREERKAVLLVSGGWPYLYESSLATPGRVETGQCAKDRMALERTDFGDLLEGLARTANRANVSFYPLNSRRERDVPQDLPAAYRQQLRQRDRRTLESIQDQLRTLADETDGMAEVKTMNLTAVTGRILSDTSSYYLIGYQPTKNRSDNRFRNITVKTTRSGIRIRARRGYGGEPPPPKALMVATPVPVKPVVDGRVLTALTQVERFDTLAPFWGRSSTWKPSPDANGGAFWYVGELGPQTRSRLPWSAGAKAEFEVVAPDKTKIMTETLDLRPADATFLMRVPAEGVLAPGEYSVRVRLTPTSDDELSVSDTIRVKVDPATLQLGEALLWRRGPSVRSSYEETADPRFRRTERLRLEFPTAAGGDASARLLDRAGHPLAIPAEVTARTDASDAFEWLIVEAPINALAPGDYAIEITQNGSMRVTAFRVVP
jgi:VWFA-related protein